MTMSVDVLQELAQVTMTKKSANRLLLKMGYDEICSRVWSKVVDFIIVLSEDDFT